MKIIYLICVWLTLFCSLSFTQNAKIDSLNKVITTTQVDTVKGKALCQLCKELHTIGLLEQALEKGLAGIQILEQGQASSDALAFCYLKIGLAYRTLGNYPKALESFQKSLKISRKLQKNIHLALCLNEIGIIYDLSKNYPQALASYQEAQRIYEQMQDQEGIAMLANNIGIIYDLLGNRQEALRSYQKGLSVAQTLKDPMGIAIFSNNIGMIYLALRDHSEALGYFEKALAIYQKIKQQEGIAIAQTNIAQSYFWLGHLQRAKYHASIGLNQAQSTKNLHQIVEGASANYRIDSALGNWKSAFEYHKLFKQYADSLHNEEKAKEFGRIESKYEFEQEAEEAKRKEAEAKRLTQIETERRNNLQYLSIFAGLIVLFGGLAFVGKLKIPARMLAITLFAALLILFEFLLILFEPILDQYTGGIPIQKLVFNSLIALGFAPLHSFLEKRLTKRFTT